MAITVKAAAKGWVMESDGCCMDRMLESGARSGYRVWLSYKVAPDMIGRDLDSDINEYGTTVLQYLWHLATELITDSYLTGANRSTRRVVRVLNHGHVVR